MPVTAVSFLQAVTGIFCHETANGSPGTVLQLSSLSHYQLQIQRLKHIDQGKADNI